MMLGAQPTIPATYWGQHLNHPLVTAAPPFTYNTHRFWDGYNTLSEAGNPDSVWSTIEPTQGSQTWTFTDSCLSIFKARGLDLVYTFFGFNYQPSWACPGDQRGKINASSLTTWVNNWLDRALTTNGIDPTKLYVNLWNEFNGPYTAGGGSIADLVTMAANFYSTVKAKDSRITVLSPTVSNCDPASTSNAGALAWRSFLLAGGGAYFDVAAMHSYHSSAASTETLLDAIDNFNQTCDACGLIGKDRWSLEGGMNWVGLSNANDQAGYVAKYHLFHWARGFKRVIWYDCDNLFSPQYYGRLFAVGDGSNTSLALTTAGTAMVEVQKWLNGATIADRLSQTSSICSAPIRRPGGYQALMLWTADRSTPSYAVPAWANQYHKLDGTVTTGLGGSGNVTLGYVPILLESGQAW